MKMNSCMLHLTIRNSRNAVVISRDYDVPYRVATVLNGGTEGTETNPFWQSRLVLYLWWFSVFRENSVSECVGLGY